MPLRIVTHRGCPLHYTVRGDAHAETVLLLQGVGAQADAWQPQAEFLAAHIDRG